ncbi:hypothetical protein ACFE04_006340 [Oxalis oulophora]
MEGEKAIEAEKAMEAEKAIKEEKAMEAEKAIEEEKAMEEEKAIEAEKAIEEEKAMEEEKAIEVEKAIEEEKCGLAEQVVAQEKTTVVAVIFGEGSRPGLNFQRFNLWTTQLQVFIYITWGSSSQNASIVYVDLFLHKTNLAIVLSFAAKQGSPIA